MSNFFQNFIKDHRVGAISATSHACVREICREIDFTKDVMLMEYGPGDGAFTRYILQKVSSGSKLIAIETNKDFVNQLQGIADPRLSVMNGDVRQVECLLFQQNGMRSVSAFCDYIISGIPFSFFSEADKRNIIKQTRKLLKNNGRFIAYQYSPMLKRYLGDFFEDVRVRVTFKNIPPYFIMIAR